MAVFPDCSAPSNDDYASHLLRYSAATNEAPTVLVLTPGSTTRHISSIHCWPGRWVSGGRAATLFCRDSQVYMHHQVGVLSARGAFLDPLQFRADSGARGGQLVNAARAGVVLMRSAAGR